MAILSGFKSFERYLKVPTEDGNKYQLMSERTLAKDVIFDDGSNLENNMSGLKLLPLNSQSEYDELTIKDPNTLYIVPIEESNI